MVAAVVGFLWFCMHGEKSEKKKLFYFLHPSGLIMGKFWGKVKLGNVVCMFDQLIILCTVFLFVQTKYFFV